MIIAFGYKHGAPFRVEKTFDVRDLTHATHSPPFLEKQREIIEYGRAHPRDNIAIGCEKGHHRSVALAQKVASALRTSLYLRDQGR